LPNGATYVGEFQGGLPSVGTETHPDGTTYAGEFQDGVPSGHGKLTSPNGRSYVGEFLGGLANGRGTEITPDGAKYVGEFRAGKPHGQGTLTQADMTLAGEFKDGAPTGQVTLTEHNGDTYVGQFSNFSFNGHGTLTRPDGSTYVGEWRNGKRHGQGTYTSLDGTVYVGAFEDGRYHGVGDLKFKAKGSLFTNSLARYSGQFRKGLKHGFGTLYSPSHAIQKQGIWDNDRFVKPKTERLFLLEEEIEVLKNTLASKRSFLATAVASFDSDLDEISAAEERARIEKEGDGSADDLACKAQKLKPSTDPYKKCRSSLLATRKAQEERERILAEKRFQENLQREKQARIAAERERERQEKARLAREAAIAADPYYVEKQQCRSFGFKDKTEKFGECVLELSRRSGATKPTMTQSSVRGDGSADDQTCGGYGYRVGTASYSDCRLQLDMARRDYEREIRAYEAEKAAYEKKVAEAQAEQKRRQQQRQAQYGFCLAQCSSQPGATTIGCMSRCGAASAGLSYDPGAPPARPSGRTTYVINGQIINCRTSPSGSVVTCN
jgi:hypothetical protein